MMKFPAFAKTRMMLPTKGERLTASPRVVFLMFLVVYLLAGSLQSGIYRLVTYIFADQMTYRVALLIQLFATAALIAGVLCYCLCMERRSLLSLGFVRQGALAEYGLGLAGGVVLFGSSVLLCMLCGVVTVERAATPPTAGVILLFFFGFLIQGMSEELLCRSFLMVSLSRGWPVWVGVMINALFFAVLHLGNSHVSAIALINIFLFGLFASLLTLRRGSIWMIGALHRMWNFAQGNLFGIPVSGIRGTPSPLVSTLTKGGVQELVNGGAFGLEGGLAVTAVLLAACILILFLPTKRSERVDS